MMKAQAVTTEFTPKIYRTIQVATLMFIIGLVIGIALRENALPIF